MHATMENLCSLCVVHAKGLQEVFGRTVITVNGVEWSTQWWSRVGLELAAAEMARQCQEDFRCDLKLKLDCDKSLARIRLVKTQNPSVCAMISWKVCRIMIALYYL
jgi:hypothetical protein